MFVFVISISFEKLKSDRNQTWVNDAIGFLGMSMRSKVIYQSHESPEVKLGGKCKSWFFFCFEKLKSNYNQICRCKMWTFHSVSGWGLVYLSFWGIKLFLCELLWYWSSLQVTVTLLEGSRKIACWRVFCLFCFVLFSRCVTFVSIISLMFYCSW